MPAPTTEVPSTVDATLDRIALDPHTVADTLGVLLKYQDDVGAITKEVAERLVAEVQAEGIAV